MFIYILINTIDSWNNFSYHFYIRFILKNIIIYGYSSINVSSTKSCIPKPIKCWNILINILTNLFYSWNSCFTLRTLFIIKKTFKMVKIYLKHSETRILGSYVCLFMMKHDLWCIFLLTLVLNRHESNWNTHNLNTIQFCDSFILSGKHRCK